MNLCTDVDLQPYHTFGLPVRAAALVTLTHENQLPTLLQLPLFHRDTVLWLGGGSNVLFAADYPGLVVHMANKGISMTPDEHDPNTVYVTAAAGEIWHDFINHTLAAGLSGLENLSLIPGTVGAAPVQNIGAYGVEVKERIVSVRCFDLDCAQFVQLSQEECRFGYRDSLFKQAARGRYVIVAVTFALSCQFVPNLRYGDVAKVVEQLAAKSPITPSLVAQAICHIRQSKLPDPAKVGNAGSFFKNPLVSTDVAQKLLGNYPLLPHYPQPDGTVKLAAGWLIDQCGLKGHTVGGAAVHPKQALVLINQHQATAADVVALAEYVCQQVLSRFGVVLEPEPIWLPAISHV